MNDNSSRSDKPMQVRSNSDRPGSGLTREIQSKIGQQLRAVYDDVVEEGVPDRFMDLLRRLEVGDDELDSTADEAVSSLDEGGRS